MLPGQLRGAWRLCPGVMIRPTLIPFIVITHFLKASSISAEIYRRDGIMRPIPRETRARFQRTYIGINRDTRAFPGPNKLLLLTDTPMMRDFETITRERNTE